MSVYVKSRLNSCVFSSSLTARKLGSARICSVIEFHAVGLACEKARSSNLVCSCRSENSVDDVDLRRWPDCGRLALSDCSGGQISWASAIKTQSKTGDVLLQLGWRVHDLFYTRWYSHCWCVCWCRCEAAMSARATRRTVRYSTADRGCSRWIGF